MRRREERGLCCFFFLLLSFQSGLATTIDLQPWIPVLIYPIVFYLGTANEVSLLRGSLLSFTAGFVYDSFCGSSMGLHTFVAVALFFAARAVRARLVLQGAIAQLLMTFLMTCVGGGFCSLFGQSSPSNSRFRCPAHGFLLHRYWPRQSRRPWLHHLFSVSPSDSTDFPSARAASGRSC